MNLLLKTNDGRDGKPNLLYIYIYIYIVWSANYASTKTLDSVRGESHHPAFVGNWPTIIRIAIG